MSQEIRSQRKCLYASAEYAASFWGKYCYIYQGKGSLRLTNEGLSLRSPSQELAIPFESIKSIGLDRFSSWTKPLGLENLTIRFERNGGLETIHLVPFESALDPTWMTSELVESWFQTLGEVEQLTGRIEPPTFEPVKPPNAGKAGILATGLIACSLGIVALAWLFIL